MTSAARVLPTLGARLRYVRGKRTQALFAQELAIALATYRNYEADLRVPDIDLAASLVRQGWNANWLLTGEGPERLNSTVADQLVGKAAEPPAELDFEVLKTIIEAVEGALEMAHTGLTPKGKAQTVMAIYRHWEAEKTSTASLTMLMKTVQAAIKAGAGG